MLQVQIKPELTSSLVPEEFLRFNQENGQKFLDNVGLEALGGLTLRLYGDGTSTIYDQEAQVSPWKPARHLDLSCNSPAAVIGMPYANDSKAYIRQNPTNPEGARALHAFFKETGFCIPIVAKILVPVDGVTFLRQEAVQEMTRASA